jgi:hypothetical protein
MKNNKSFRGGNDMESNYNIPLIIFIVLLIILVIGTIYILFFREQTPTPTITSIPIPTPTSVAEDQNPKRKKILKIIKENLKNWGNDINNLPKEIKEAVIKCYDNPEGCIF